MSSKKSYNRFFIIFQEEDKGYGIGPDRPPTGYAKVETKSDKSKVTVYVQNLKPFDTGECLYRCYLISHQDDKDCTVYLGMLNIDELGRGESSWESGADNAFESKTPIDKFNGAAVVVEREGVDKVIAPLAGYMSKEKFDWRSRIPKPSAAVVNESIEEVKTENVEEIKVSEEAKKFQEYEETINKLVEKKEQQEVVQVEERVEETEQVIEQEVVQQIETNVSDTLETIEVPRVEKAKTDASWDGYVQNVPDAGTILRDKHKEYKHEHYGCPMYHKYNYRPVIRKMLEDILADYEKMDKHKDMKDCILWKIDMDRYKRDIYKVNMYPCYDLIFYPMIFSHLVNYYKYISKHGHYLFGIKCDKDKGVLAVVFGIPGRRKPCDQPFEGKTGFVKWIPSGTGDLGYWVMMYDPMTGVIFTQK